MNIDQERGLDWLVEGNRVAVIINRHVTGVGSYDRVRTVTITRVTPTLARTRSDGDGTRVFRRDGYKPLTDRADDRVTLAPLNDPRVTATRRQTAQHDTGRLARNAIENWATDIQTKPEYIAQDPDGHLDDTLNALAKIRDAATKAHTDLLRLKEGIY